MDDDHAGLPEEPDGDDPLPPEPLEDTWISHGTASAGEFTRRLRRGRVSDQINALLALVYSELHRRAVAEKHRFPENSLQATEVLDAALMRLTEKGQTDWRNRRYFFHLAGRAMRDVLSDHMRRRRAGKRGAGLQAVSLDSICEPLGESPAFVSTLTEALRRLSREDPWGATVVEMRFFFGLNRDETAERLGVSPRTVDRRWVASKTRLRELMTN